MKKYLLLITFILLTNISAQSYNPADIKDNDIIKSDPRMDQFNFVPGQILIKFRDDTNIYLAKTSGGNSVLGIAKIDQILSKYKMQLAAKLFENEIKQPFPKKLKTFSGDELTIPNLHNIYKLEFDSTENIFQIIDELKEDSDNVEYAEPNYILRMVDSKSLSPELSQEEMIEWIKDHPDTKTNFSASPTDVGEAVVPNDPLFSEQWGINITEIDKVWSEAIGDTSQVIAILDTGIDWLHPDLMNKIWTNPEEIPDNGWDDDGNGLVDDVRGWDWINWDNNPRDDNGHGTHVAGIAAAESNNGIGIAGVNWNAKIMPLKILSYNGYGDAARISEAVQYAASKKATVINMSFGSYANSFTLKNVLAAAYGTCVLVAGAGNDHYDIYDKNLFGEYRTSFPAAYSFVLGVQDNYTSPPYSNYDSDGPIYSRYDEGYNYELQTAGSGIISTFPGGKYKSMTGTSMASPLAAGMLSLYKSYFKERNNEDLWADFIHSSEFVNLREAMFPTKIRKPIFDLISFAYNDSTLDSDNDNQADAGETINLSVIIRNTFAKSDSAKIKLIIDPDSYPYYKDYILFERDEIFLGSISTYARKSNKLIPFTFKIKNDFPNEMRFEMGVLMWDEHYKDTTYQKYSFSVFNGTELAGIIEEDIILTPDRLWMINNSARLSEGKKMIIKAGTHLIVNASFDNRGTIEIHGTPDSLVIMEGKTINPSYSKYATFNMNGNDLTGGRFEYCNINNSGINTGDYFKCKFLIGKRFGGVNLNNCIVDGFSDGNYGYTLFRDYIADTLKNNIVKNSVVMGFGGSWIPKDISVFKNNFINDIFYSNEGRSPVFGAWQNVRNNNIINAISYLGYFYPHYADERKTIYLYSNPDSTKIKNNNHILDKSAKWVYFCETIGSSNYFNFPNQYWGTSNVEKISKRFYDFRSDATRPLLSIEPKLNAPSDSAHGIVWKVLVNGKDAQDEYVDPLGVGIHKFEVYFNREMDRNYPPNISFGVREPFTQQPVKLNGSWSDDGKIYTAYKKIELYTGDGINTIRVADARDPEDFEIPIEDCRFEFLINAAGSASIDFTVAPGIGKVDLEWTTPSDLPTLLGYNIYRFEHIDDTTLTAPQQINTSLITDTLYTDFAVQPLKKYYYQYKVVRTDFSESDFSKVVNTTVLTATAGDANGDLAVNILDITTVVNYILAQNPQPFILAAADFNNDGQVNILDIVAIINKILNPNGGAKMLAGNAPKIRFTDTGAYLKNGIGVAGLELNIAAQGVKEGDLIAGSLLKGMEFSYKIENDTIKIIAYSFKNETISGEDGALFTLAKGKITKLIDLKAADKFGNKVEVEYSNDDIVLPTEYILYQNYPNPFNPVTTIRYALPERKNVEITIYNILGQRVKLFTEENVSAGYHEIKWNSRNDHNQMLASGVYIYQIKAGNYVNQKKMILLK